MLVVACVEKNIAFKKKVETAYSTWFNFFPPEKSLRHSKTKVC